MAGELEEWRIILDSPVYAVSNKGRVRNNRRDGQIVTPRLINGYLAVDIHSEVRYIHRLVYRAFIDEDLGMKRVMHKDGNTQNNKPVNLILKGKSRG